MRTWMEEIAVKKPGQNKHLDRERQKHSSCKRRENEEREGARGISFG